MVKKIAMTEQGKKFYIADTEKDFHCQYGFIKKEDFGKDEAETNKGKKMAIFDPSFIDIYQKIKRGAQIISLKDIGIIIAETGIGTKSKIVDAGAGSGALCCFLANIAKEVISYDIREDHLKIVEKNKELLGLKNLTLKNKDIYEGIDENDVDVVILDVPEPWKAIMHAKKALKKGGFIVSYSPSVPQMMDFVNAANKQENLVHLKTVEIIQREWEIDERKVRPKTRQIGHTGFLSFVRKI